MSQELIDRAKRGIQELSYKHSKLNDDIDSLVLAEECEIQAEMIILDYCLSQDYKVNGFSPILLFDNEEVEDINDYLMNLRFYFDSLSLERIDVAELSLYYQSVFWPDFIETMDEFIARIHQQIDSGKFYDLDVC